MESLAGVTIESAVFTEGFGEEGDSLSLVLADGRTIVVGAEGSIMAILTVEEVKGMPPVDK